MTIIVILGLAIIEVGNHSRDITFSMRAVDFREVATPLRHIADGRL